MNKNYPEIHQKYMRRALELASKGFPWAFPNPMVGAVITDLSGNIIGEGYHRKCGGPHAEVNAIASVRDSGLLKESTMYVTLEPCAHTGRTGPCARLIIEKEIPQVVVGCRDPFDKVNGKGIDLLRAAGVKVTMGVLEEDCKKLNAVFFTAHTQHRPFVILKWAQSGDGFLDSDRISTEGLPEKMSTPLSSRFMHRLRAICDGILVGSSTVLRDNPKLDTRLWPGNSPRPVIPDARRRLGQQLKIMERDPLIVEEEMSISDMLQSLYEQGFTSIMVEGGADTINRFIEGGIWDLARIETANFNLVRHGRIPAPVIGHRIPDKIVGIGSNIVKYYINNPLVDVKNL